MLLTVGANCDVPLTHPPVGPASPCAGGHHPGQGAAGGGGAPRGAAGGCQLEGAAQVWVARRWGGACMAALIGRVPGCHFDAVLHALASRASTAWILLVRHCRYCFSQGAYRGAGADSLRQRFRVDVGAAAGALPELPQGEEGEQGGAVGPLLALCWSAHVANAALRAALGLWRHRLPALWAERQAPTASPCPRSPSCPPFLQARQPRLTTPSCSAPSASWRSWRCWERATRMRSSLPPSTKCTRPRWTRPLSEWCCDRAVGWPWAWMKPSPKCRPCLVFSLSSCCRSRIASPAPFSLPGAGAQPGRMHSHTTPSMPLPRAPCPTSAFPAGFALRVSLQGVSRNRYGCDGGISWVGRGESIRRNGDTEQCRGTDVRLM